MGNPFDSVVAGEKVGPLEEVFADVFRQWGTVRMAKVVRFPRNMVVLRQGDELAVIHGVKLPDADRQRLEQLGEVRHLIRLGSFHGMDDAHYAERYRPTVWAPPGIRHKPGVSTDIELVEGAELPFADLSVFAFANARKPEVALLCQREGGILLTCDSVQNWERYDGCNVPGRVGAWLQGFRGRAVIGSGWRRYCEPRDGVGFAPDFARLLELDFHHLISAHGPPLIGQAKSALARQVARTYRG